MSRLFIYYCSFLAFGLVSSHLVFDSCDADGQVAYEACDPSTKELNIHKCAPLFHFDADVDPNPFFSSITIPESIACSGCASGTKVTSVKVHINFFHEWLGDVQAFLLHNGVKRRQVFGVAHHDACSNDNIDATFYDSAADAPFDGSSCHDNNYVNYYYYVYHYFGGFNMVGSGAPVLSMDHQPIDSFDVFIGDTIGGVWTLEINDVTHLQPGDGYFVEWSLTLNVDECPVLTYACTPSACCVNDCSIMRTGNYQSCSTCNGYVACSNGYKHDMACADSIPGTLPLVWDDNKHSCQYTSATCPSNPASVPECPSNL